MRFISFPWLLCLSMLPAAAVAQTIVSIAQPDIPLFINAPGEYHLAEDITAPAEGAAVVIAASEVIIDLQGHTITGPGMGIDQPAFAFAAAEEMDLESATIRNGTIREFPTSAINLPKAAGVVVHDMIVQYVAGIAVDVGDEAIIRNNTLRDLRIEDSTQSASLIAIRAGLNSTIDSNTINAMHHGGNGQIDAIRVERGCYVIRNRISGMTTNASGTGDMVAIACATMAADIRANEVSGIANQRPGGIAIGIRIGSGSAEGNRVTNVSAASLPIGIQGIAAVFIERNIVDGVRAINRGPDAYGIWAAGTGGRVTGNTIRGVDCAGDDPRHREVGLRINSAFEVSENTVHLPHHRSTARQAGVEISGQFNVIVENTIRIGNPGDAPGTMVLLGPVTRSNTIGGNDAPGRVRDYGTDNRVPTTPEDVPAI
jgi:hypothetical protein